MKRMFFTCLSVIFCLSPTKAFTQGADSAILDEVDKRIPTLREWAKDPVILTTLRKANARQRSTSSIQELDARWQSTAGLDAFMRSILDNPAAERLRSLRSKLPEISEAFLTDRLGANAAMTNKTSDYWQGDEAKFTKAIRGGRNSYHVDPVSFDESIQAYAVQIALPVFDQGVAIGVLVVTLNLEELERMR